MYINTQTNEYPITEDQIRQQNPEVLFSVPFVPPEGYAVVFRTPQPAVDQMIQGVSETAPVQTDGKWVQAWNVYDLDQATVKMLADNQTAAVSAQFKLDREKAMNALTVTTAAGNVFDGDEISQGRMLRAIFALQFADVASVNWVLVDNSVIQATKAELSEALVLAGNAQASLWISG